MKSRHTPWFEEATESCTPMMEIEHPEPSIERTLRVPPT